MSSAGLKLLGDGCCRRAGWLLMARMRVPDSLRDALVSLQCLPNEDLNRCHHDDEGAGCISQKSSLAASVFEGSMTVPVLPSEFPVKVEIL